MSQEIIVSVLAWGFVVVGGAFCVLLSWFAIRIVNQLDRMTELFQNEIHRHDIRITRLEERQGVTRRSTDLHELDDK